MVHNLNSGEKIALDNWIHTPAESSTRFVKYALDIQGQPGATFGCILDNYIIPIRPGKKFGIVGRPGMGKTSFGGYLLKREAKSIVARGNSDHRYVAHVTWEQPAEELEAMYSTSPSTSVTDIAWGRADLSEIIKGSLDRPTLPIWIFGESLAKTSLKSPEFTVEGVFDSIRAVEKKWSMTPTLLFFDFIQNIPVPDERDRQTKVTEAMRKAARLAKEVKAGLVLGIQSNRRADEYNVPIPTLRDMEWSSTIEQLLDTIVAVWRPIRTWLPNEKESIKVSGVNYPNTEDLLVVKLLKQRFESGSGSWAVRFNMKRLVVTDYKVAGYGSGASVS